MKSSIEKKLLSQKLSLEELSSLLREYIVENRQKQKVFIDIKLPTQSAWDAISSFTILPNSTANDYLCNKYLEADFDSAIKSDWDKVGDEIYQSYLVNLKNFKASQGL